MILFTDLIAFRRGTPRNPAPAREAPPGAGDLIAESRDAIVRADITRAPVEAYDRRHPVARRVTDDWPDPYGPDVTVFGPAPHRGA